MYSLKHLRRETAEYGGMIAALVILVLTFTVASRNFWSILTVSSIANQIADLTIVSVGMTFVLIAGGIDLSVGSLLALASAIFGVLMVDRGWPVLLAVPTSLACTTLCGVVSGGIAVSLRIPSFIVTLGMMEIARGGAYWVTDSQTKYVGNSIEWLGTSLPGWLVSPAFLVALGVVFIGQFVLRRTIYGRLLVAIGTNAETVRLSGINTMPYLVATFAISGFLSGLGALVHTSRLSAADPNGAIGMELSAIAACVIGGTSLRGGRGSVVNTFFGVLIVAVLQTGLAHLGTAEPLKRIITGGVIVLAALVDAIRSDKD